MRGGGSATGLSGGRHAARPRYTGSPAGASPAASDAAAELWAVADTGSDRCPSSRSIMPGRIRPLFGRSNSTTAYQASSHKNSKIPWPSRKKENLRLGRREPLPEPSVRLGRRCSAPEPKLSRARAKLSARARPPSAKVQSSAAAPAAASSPNAIILAAHSLPPNCIKPWTPTCCARTRKKMSTMAIPQALPLRPMVAQPKPS